MTELVERTITTAVGRTVLLEGGEGPDLLYLHSVYGDRPTELLATLAETHHVVAPWMAGFGTSEGMEAVRDVEDMAMHVLDIVDRLDLGSPAIVGGSLGGWLAAEVAVRRPSLPAALVLVNPLGLYLRGHELPELFNLNHAGLAELLLHPDCAEAARLRGLEDMEREGVKPPFTEMAGYLQAMMGTARIGWNPYLHNPKLAGWLPRITAPTLVLRGEQDRFVPAAHAARFADLIEGAELSELPGAGHVAALDSPAALATQVTDFLAHAAAPARA